MSDFESDYKLELDADKLIQASVRILFGFKLLIFRVWWISSKGWSVVIHSTVLRLGKIMQKMFFTSIIAIPKS